jgi:hypothetical protein
MGLFGKERTGTLQAVERGQRYQWILKDFASFAPKAYDSEHGEGPNGASFHFHLILGPAGDVGFYIHYKRTPVPKYSFWFCVGEHRSRQHTAINIPPDTERVGHWNCIRVPELHSMLQQGNSKDLTVVFVFDHDKVTANHSPGGSIYDWVIPRPVAQNFAPFTSPVFLIDGLNFVIRVDVKPNGDAIAFLFSRRCVIPPHRISAILPDGMTVCIATEVSTDMTAKVLNIPAAMFRDLISASPLHLRVEVSAGGNPLDNFLGSPAAAAQDEGPATVPGCEGGRIPYIVVQDDV